MMPIRTPTCFNAVSRLMPIVRAETAKRLMRRGLQQGRVAEHLGVSQAMVSKYMRRAPRADPLLPATLIDQVVESSVHAVLEDESHGRIPPWCPLCSHLSGKGLMGSFVPLAKMEECARQLQPAGKDEAGRVLENLAQAAERIRRLPFRRLLPQVRSNLAMCLPEAVGARDVAAFPGRFVEIRGEVRAASTPELGSSSHLSQMMLKLRRYQPALRAVLNAKFTEDVRRAVRAAGLRIHVLKRNRGDLAIVVPRDAPADAVVDPGAFGVEPALYVLGESAVAVVAKVERILKHLRGGNGA